MARTPIRIPGKAATAKETTTTTETEATSSPSEPVTPPVEPVQEATAEVKQTDQLDQILQNQIRIESKLDQLLKVGGIEAPKKQRWVEGKHGLELREVK